MSKTVIERVCESWKAWNCSHNTNTINLSDFFLEKRSNLASWKFHFFLPPREWRRFLFSSHTLVSYFSVAKENMSPKKSPRMSRLFTYPNSALIPDHLQGQWSSRLRPNKLITSLLLLILMAVLGPKFMGQIWAAKRK